MTEFPNAGVISGAANQGIAKQAFEDLLATAKQLQGGKVESTLVIAAGQITPTGGTHSVDTEAAAATDDLDTIVTTNLPDTSYLWLRPAVAGRVVVVRNNQGGAGKILTLDGANVSLTTLKSWMLLKRTGTDWEEVLRSVSATAVARGSYPALINGNFDVWQRGTGALSSPAGSRTYRADRWYVNPTGAAVTQQRSTTVPDKNSRYSLEIAGAASVTTVLIGERLEAHDVKTKLLSGAVTFSWYIQNLSGAAFTPDLLLGTPAAADDFTTVTNRLTQALQSCADAQWTRMAWTVDISGFTNIDNGLQVELRIPSGSLVAGDTVRVAQAQAAVEPSFGGFVQTEFADELRRCLRFFRKSYDYANAPGAVSDNGSRNILLGAGTSNLYVQDGWDIRMIGVPTMTIYSPATGTAARVRNISTAADATVNSVIAGEMGLGRITLSAVQTDQNALYYHYTAEREL